MSPRLFLDVVLIEARTRMSYRVDFWINAVVGFGIQVLLAWFLWAAVFRESGATRIAGYDLPAMLLYFVAAVLYGQIVRGPELAAGVSTDIYDGGLNRYLVFPASYFLVKYAQGLGSLAPALIQLVLLGSLFPLLVTSEAGVAVTAGTVAMSLVTASAANLLYFVMSFPLQCVAFWADNVWSLSVALRLVSGLLGGFLLPLAVFPEAAQPLLRWLPFRFFYDEPVGVLLGRVGVGAWLEGLGLCLAWTALLLLPARAVWRRGTLQYSGIGM